MSFNTYPYSPFPASTEQLHRGDNEDLQAQIDAIKDGNTIDSFGDVETALATKTDNSVIAPEFDAEAGVYSVGDLVMYEGKLYEFTTAHETAGEWNAEEVTEKTVADEVDSLKSGLINSNMVPKVNTALATILTTETEKAVTATKNGYITVSSGNVGASTPTVRCHIYNISRQYGCVTTDTIPAYTGVYFGTIPVAAGETIVAQLSGHSVDASIIQISNS